MYPTQPYGDITKAKVLIIGHDPRLQQSDTMAGFCFFADYYFIFKLWFYVVILAVR